VSRHSSRSQLAPERRDRSVHAFLLAIDSARSSIALTNPYFVPYDGIARALARAAE
jgi:phosphatidylserine/phosphatidylglycerophosphate/cardiolipin synthase-like enzyme